MGKTMRIVGPADPLYINQIIAKSGPLKIGSATSGHSLTATNDLLIAGKLEVDGAAFLDSTLDIAEAYSVIDIGVPGFATGQVRVAVAAAANRHALFSAESANAGTNAISGLHGSNNQTGEFYVGVYGSGMTGTHLGITAANYLTIDAFGASLNGILIGCRTDDPIVFGANNLEQMRLTSSALQVNNGLANGQYLNVKSKTVSHTLSLANDSVEIGFVPAGSIVVGLSTRVTTAVTTSGATNTFGIGDGNDSNRFGTAIAGTLGTTTTIANWAGTNGLIDIPIYSAASGVKFTAPGVETFTAGVIRITIHYIDLTAATS